MSAVTYPKTSPRDPNKIIYRSQYQIMYGSCSLHGLSLQIPRIEPYRRIRCARTRTQSSRNLDTSSTRPHTGELIPLRSLQPLFHSSPLGTCAVGAWLYITVVRKSIGIPYHTQKTQLQSAQIQGKYYWSPRSDL